MPARAPVRHISLEFDPYIPWNRGVLGGIEAYARGVPEWRLLRHRLIPGPRLFLDEADKRIDGFLSTGELEWARKTGIPLVRFGPVEPEEGFPVVEVDNREIGRLAARNLIENGYRTIALLEIRELPGHERMREAGFVGGAEASQVEVGILSLVVQSVRQLLNDRLAVGELVRKIAALEKPLGLFARSLAEAYILHSLLSEGGFIIPDEVGLIVGGNDREMLEALQPPLTSVSRNSYEIGYEAARALRDLMRGDAVEPSIVVPPGGVIDRGSTRLQAIGDAVVRKARDLIRQRIDQPLHVDVLARELGVSGRSLRRRFQAALRHSPVREIQLARLETAQDLLANSRVSILEIAQRCGFAESSQLSTFFKAEAGVTPTQFRNRILG